MGRRVGRLCFAASEIAALRQIPAYREIPASREIARSEYHPAAAESSAARKAQAPAEIQPKLKSTVRGSPQIQLALRSEKGTTIAWSGFRGASKQIETWSGTSGTLPGSRKGDGASSTRASNRGPFSQAGSHRGAFEAFADQAVLLREEDLVFRTLLVPLLHHGFEQKAAALAVQSFGIWGDSLKGAPSKASRWRRQSQ